MSTLGLLPCTAAAAEVTLPHASGAARVVVAHSAKEWRDAWTAAGGGKDPIAVDFDRDMIVGVINGAKDDRVVYRVQLDSAETPTALEVHLAGAGAPCGFEHRTPAKAAAHFIVTPRSALPVHFVLDAMVDGMFYVQDPSSEGVGRSDVATLDASAVVSSDKAATREAAEHAVFATLSAAERAKLAKGPLDRTLGRIPHGWTKLAVAREHAHWVIRYDDLAFEVDAATGKVTKR